MLRIAAAEDLTALTQLRRAATGDSAEDAAGWLQRVAGLENILLLEKPGAPPALMLAAVPVHYAHRKGIWFTGLAADRGVPADKLLPKLLEGALRAFAEKGCDFAVMTPDTAADAARLGALGFKNLLPLRVVSALSVALYGMFLAIIIPPARKDRIVAVLVVISFALSFLCSYLPGISALSEGTRTILLTVTISGAAAVLFPVRQEENEDDA